MAKKVIGLEVDIPVGQAEKNVKNLQTKLQELKKTLYDLDKADPQFNKLAKEAAMMEDKIADVNKRVKQLSSDTKNLEGFTATVSGIAGGFAAAQGAAALFSDENEEVQKSILKVQAALTALNGVQEVANQLNKTSKDTWFAKTQAQKAYNLVVGQSTGALKVFKLALAATGIGLLVLTLGAIIANWDKISKAVKENTSGLIDFGKAFDKVKAVAMGVFNSVIAYYKTLFDIISKAIQLDFEGAIDSAKNLGKNVVDAYNQGFQEQVERNEEANRRKLIEASLGDTKRLIARLQAQGKDVYAVRQKLLKDELSLLEKGSEEYNDKLNEIEVLRIERQKEISDKRQEEIKKDGEERIKEEERIAGIIEETRNRLELNSLKGKEKELRELEMQFEKKKELVKGNAEAERLVQAEYLQAIQAIEDTYAQQAREKRDAEYEEDQKKLKEDLDKKLAEQKAYEDNLRELRVSSALGIVSALSEINDAFSGDSERAARKQFNIQKALSLAETVVSTYAAAQKAYASQVIPGDPTSVVRGFIAAGVSIAGGLARAAAISKQQFESSSAPSIPRDSGGGGGAPAQSTPQITQDITRTRLGANDNGQLDLKVYVTESDITQTQQRVNRIERRATVE